MFSVFPVTIAAILLPGWMATLCGVSAFALVGGLIGCEIAAPKSPLPLGHAHQGLLDYFEHPVFILALLVAAAMTLFGIVYFVRSVVSRHQEAEEQRRQHERIAQSRERLARVGVIAAGVAHSVRNPLHGVFNCLDLVRGSAQPSEARELLDLATEGLSRIEQVTTRLLALSRDAPMRPEPVDLGDLVRDTLRLLEVRMHNRGIELDTQRAAELLGVPRTTFQSRLGRARES